MRMKPCKYCVPHWERLMPQEIAPGEMKKIKVPGSSKRRKSDDDFQSERRARPQVKKDSSSEWTSSEEDTEVDDRIYTTSVAYYAPTHRSFAADLPSPLLPHNLADTASLGHLDTYSPYSEDSATDDQTSSSAWSSFDEITIMPLANGSMHRSVGTSAPRPPRHHFVASFPSSIDIFNANSSPATGSIYNPLALPDLGWMDV
eukprot:TRINITY_DN2190_c0_g1_i2.p1 TRINITY_DN2190_c0_g1~~TRINITY_DN2190_c0_g1_i2.p1  ORF type:complete len:202 (+),score=26.79 TRINITY_DN2190_c0_g1_i2:301-906(+)